MKYKVECSYNRRDSSELNVIVTYEDSSIYLSMFVHQESENEQIELIWWVDENKLTTFASAYDKTVNDVFNYLELHLDLEDIILIENMLSNVVDDVFGKTNHELNKSFPKKEY